MTRRGLSYTIRCAECGTLADDVAAIDAPKFEDTDRKLAKVNQLMGVKP